jgi:hypothetical protein
MTRNGEHHRLTVEVLAADCLDVHELHRAGLLNRPFVARVRAGILAVSPQVTAYEVSEIDAEVRATPTEIR